MEWAEDSRETGATAIAIAICSFSPPPSSFQQLNLSFCNQQPDCFQAKQNPTPLQIYIFYPKNSLRRNRGSRENNTTTAAAISTTVAASKSLSFPPFIELGVGNNFNYLLHWNSQPRKRNSINQSIAACFQDFASFDDLFTRIVLLLSKRIAFDAMPFLQVCFLTVCIVVCY
jgi:hypothetical protein